MNEKIKILQTITNEKDFYLYITLLLSEHININEITNYLNQNNIEYSYKKILKSIRDDNVKILNLKLKENNIYLQEKYDIILKSYINLTKSLNIQKPIDLCLFFDYLLREGYFSLNKEFKYSDDNKTIGAYSIISGTGVCLNMSLMLIDYLKAFGIESKLYINYLKNGEKTLLSLINGNHSSVYIKDKENFIYDITNRNFFYKKGHNKYETVTGDTICYDRNSETMDVTSNKEYLLNEVDKSIDKLEKVIENNNDIINDVYESVKSYIEEMNDLIKDKSRVR